MKVKFNTTYAKEDVKYDEIPEIKLGQPDQKFSEANAHNMMLPISRRKELDETIKSLQADKAEGQDGITNEMLKNTGEQARTMILDMFKNLHKPK